MNAKSAINIIVDKLEGTINWRLVDRFLSSYQRSKLKSQDFSIIGNNCVTGGIYHKFGLPYTSPTIWSFFFPEEYIRFVENLEWYLKQPLEFTSVTKHPMAQRLRESLHSNYPIGVLGGDIEVHFMHYASEKEAFEKWARRVKRVNLENIFIIFSDAEEEFREELLERFERLPYSHKIFFSSKPRSSCKSTVFIKDYVQETHVNDSTRNRKYEKYVDLVKWLNREENYLKKKRKSSPNGLNIQQTT